MNTNFENDKNSLWNRFTIEIQLFAHTIGGTFVGSQFITLCKVDTNVKELNELIEASGFNNNHPHYDILCDLVRETFTREEVAEILSCLSFTDIRDITIARANPLGSIKGMDKFKVNSHEHEYQFLNFPYLDGCTPPINVMGKIPSEDEIPF